MKEGKTLDVVNGIDKDILQKTIKALEHEPKLGKCTFKVSNKWLGANCNCTTIKSFFSAGQDTVHKQKFILYADEPPILAGEDKASNPVEQLLSALASCVTTSMVAHAAVKGIHIEQLESQIEGDIDLNGYLGLSEDIPKGFTNIRIAFHVKSDMEDTDELKKLAEYSPVYNTIINGADIDIQVLSKQ